MNNLNTEQKTILVAGANGNLGLEIINRLENDVNNRIIAVSREVTPVIRQHSSVTYYTYQELFSEQELKIDIIINCAYPLKINANEDNLNKTRRLALSLMDLGIKRWNSRLYINMSCHCVYGEHRETPVREDVNIDGRRNLDQYAEHRFTTERLLERATNNHIVLINLRLADMVGQMYSQQIIDDLIREALSSNSVTPINVRNRYSFIDIDDVTNTVNRIINTDLFMFGSTVYNLGTISNFMTPNFGPITTQNIVEIIGNSIPNTRVNDAINDEHNGEIRYLMDSTALFEILHWKPEISIVNSIIRRIEEIRLEFI